MRRRLAVTERATVETPPSTLARQFNTLPLSRFALHYPPTPDVIPLALLHPIFAEFVEDVQLHNPTRADNELARGLSDAMSKNYPLEADRCHKFRDLLIDHYRIHLYAAGVGGTTRTTDGDAMVGQFMVIVCEGKEGNRGGCPDVQGCLYWVEAIRKMVEVNDPLNVLPCIVISLFGACLLLTLYPCLFFIGPTIGFYGTVLTDRVQLEPLTDHFTLNLNHHEDFSRVARAFGALRIAFNKLCEYYQNLPTPRSPERVMFPYPDGWTANGDVELTYHSRVDKNRLIFLATTTNGAKVLVKFTRRYSEEVHQYCARAGVAPELLGFLPLPAGWYMVIMEYLDPETYRTLEPSDGSNNDLVAGIRQVVKTLHGGGFVHGDIRHVNILTRRSLEDAQNVFLIDFDWAGLEGKTRYPPNINLTSVVRPEGVEDGELIQQAHDWFMVEHIFCANKIWF